MPGVRFNRKSSQRKKRKTFGVPICSERLTLGKDKNKIVGRSKQTGGVINAKKMHNNSKSFSPRLVSPDEGHIPAGHPMMQQQMEEQKQERRGSLSILEEKDEREEDGNAGNHTSKQNSRNIEPRENPVITTIQTRDFNHNLDQNSGIRIRT